MVCKLIKYILLTNFILIIYETSNVKKSLLECLVFLLANEGSEYNYNNVNSSSAFSCYSFTHR